MIASPEAANSVRRPSTVVAASRAAMLSPLASLICEATVRFQIRSYSLASSDPGPTARATESGSVKRSPAGRIASCASWAFLTVLVYTRGLSGRYDGP